MLLYYPTFELSMNGENYILWIYKIAARQPVDIENVARLDFLMVSTPLALSKYRVLH